MTTRSNTHGTGELQDWQAPQCGQPVRLRHQRQEPVSGVIDMRTDDGSVIWVQLNDGGGRRLIHRDDGYQLEAAAGRD
ncbi:hypothetical protein [Arthrobacter castelli]|uniref:hypothetical protein n=1 Tax=Arthrobacter castelli TaxID=271431 RepID=UPI001B7FA16C|nr:hypothetical protein [Arthrobacter castelli]